MITDSKLKEIVDKTDIVSLVSEYVTLQKRGKNYFGLCPFHDDQSPSFSVSPEKKIAKCMSCGEGGNPINFLRKIKNISFEEAAKELADKAGVKLDIEVNVNFDNSKNIYYQINKDASSYYENFLFNSKSGIEALDYLKKRGLTEDVIKKFKIGLAPKEKSDLYKFLNSKGYQDIDLLDLGLVNSDNDGFHDVITNRITFPIIDDNNHYLGFSARIYYQSDTEPRYINTKETPIYQKGFEFYNLNNAISEIRKKKFVILCEGQMDVISMYNNGFTNVICSLGTALTEDQVKKLSKYTSQILILYDGDNAGMKATKKAFNLLSNFKAYSVTLPNGSDPDEYIKANGPLALNEYIKHNSIDKYEFNYKYAFKDKNLNDPYDFNDVKTNVFNFIRESKDNYVLEKYLKKFANDCNISYESLVNEFKLKNETKKPVKVEIKEEKLLPHEVMFLALIIYDKKYFDYFNEELEDVSNYSSKGILCDIYQTISYFYKNYLNNKVNEKMEYIKQELPNIFNMNLESQIVDSMTHVADKEFKDIEREMLDIIEKFRQDQYKGQINSLKQKNINDPNVLNELLELARNKNKENERKRRS